MTRLEDRLFQMLEQGGLERGISHHWGFRELDGRRVFVKACADRRRLPRLMNEWHWLTKIHAVAPTLVPEPLLYADQVPRYCAALVTGLVSGEQAARLEPTRAAWGLGRALRALHSLPIAGEQIGMDGRSWSDWRSFVRESMHDYLEGIRSSGGALASPLVRELNSAAEIFVNTTHEPSLTALHGDPTNLNLLVDQGSSCLVDLELAQAGDPLFDLATALLLSVRGDEAASKALFEGYGLVRTREVEYKLWFYQLLRQVRLARGKVWIHGQPEAFAEEMRVVEVILAGRAAAEVGRG